MDNMYVAVKHLFSSLMNELNLMMMVSHCSRVVNINKEQLHASTNALNGYCAFHRLLLMFVDEFPQIKEQANKTVNNFVRNESFRLKTVVSNLGQFLSLLTFTDITWQKVAIVCVVPLVC